MSQGPWKNMKHGLDEKIEFHPRNVAQDVFNEDFESKNSAVLETKWKHSSGSLKYVLTGQYKEENDKVSAATSEKVKLDMSCGKISYRFETAPDKFTETVDFGTFNTMEDQVLVNPWVKASCDGKLEKRAVGLGALLRYGGLKYNHLFWLEGAKRFWKSHMVWQNNDGFITSKVEDLDLNTLDTKNKLSIGYLHDNKCAAFFNMESSYGKTLNKVEKVELLLSYIYQKNTTAALQVGTSATNWKEVKANMAVEHKVDPSMRVKAKIDCCGNAENFFEWKSPIGLLSWSFATNLLLHGKEKNETGFKGFGTLPWNMGLKLKVDG